MLSINLSLSPQWWTLVDVQGVCTLSFWPRLSMDRCTCYTEYILQHTATHFTINSVQLKKKLFQISISQRKLIHLKIY